MADGFGEQFKNYPVDVQKGIILHRAIDTFTDAHPVLDKVLKTAFKIPSLCWCDRRCFLRSFSGEKLDYIFK
jgi:hypothetical protein